MMKSKNVSRVLILPLFFVLLLGQSLSAQMWFVNGTTGNDASSGTAVDQAFKTISRGAAASQPGDTVVVAEGTYDELVAINKYPNAAEPTIIRAAAVGKVILAGEEKQFRFSIRQPRVSIIGFVIRNSREHAIDFAAPADDGLVSDCIITDNKLDGAFFADAKGGRVQSTVCARNGRNGIWFLRGSGGVAVSNTLTSNRTGIFAQNCPGTVCFNNIIAENSVGAVISDGSIGSFRSDHNLFEGGFLGGVNGGAWLFGARAGTLADWQALSGQDAHSIEGDPMLADPKAGDYAPAVPPRGNASPALREDVRAKDFQGIEAPTTDLFGRSASKEIIPALGAVWAQAAGAGKPVAAIRVPFDGRLSVGIYDTDGRLIRTVLAAYPAGKGELKWFWDGKDNRGAEAPAGQYEWRAIAHNVRAVDDGSVGDTGTPPYGKTQVSDSVCGLATDRTGDLYEISFWDESGHCMRKLKADGTADWVIPFYIRNTAGGFGTAVATDGKYVFAALARRTRDLDGGRAIADDIRRLDAATGAPADFPAQAGAKADNLIAVNPEKPKVWMPAQQMTDEDARTMFGVRGLAVDGTRLFVSNYYAGRIELYDKDSGGKLSEFAVPRPLGIAAGPDGSLWVANSGDRVTQFTPAGEKRSEIPGLRDPYAVATGGPGNHLLVMEFGAGQIREYALAANGPQQVRTLGKAAAGAGPVEPGVFRWNQYGGLAIDAAGRISVTDIGNHRVQRFNPDGSLWQSLYSDFVSAPFIDIRQPDTLMSGTRQYTVNHKTGAWEFTFNWQPADGKFSTEMVLRRQLPNGRDYLYHLGGHRMGVVIYAIEGNTMRRSAMLGGRWMGADDLGTGDVGGRYFWIDADGDGTVEDQEITWDQAAGKDLAYYALAPGWWVDAKGDCWFADAKSQTIMRVALRGFDERGNPMYDWAKRETVVPRDESPWKFQPTNMRIAPDGDLYVQGTTDGNRDTSWFWMGGTAVARFSPEGKRRWITPLPRVAVATDTDGEFWYAGEGPTAKVSMYTSDGLLVCSMAPGKPSGYQSGWIDHAMGVFAFKHPKLGRHYVYAEEDLFGKMIRYRIEALDTLRRFNGKFNWPGRQ